jgi:intracellular septation protein
VATAVAIIATIAQIGWLGLKYRKVEPMQWASLGLIVVFGGLTIGLQDKTFIQWKPTILFGGMAIAIAIAQFWLKKNPIAFVFNNTIQAPAAVWRKLSLAWIVFLLLIAFLNIWFAYYTSTDTWVLFKTFGDMGLFFVFIVAQIFWLLPYLPDENAAPEPAPLNDAPGATSPVTEGKR